MMWRLVLTTVLILGGQFALGDDLTSVVPPPGSPAGPTFGQPGLATGATAIALRRGMAACRAARPRGTRQ